MLRCFVQHHTLQHRLLLLQRGQLLILRLRQIAAVGVPQRQRVVVFIHRVALFYLFLESLGVGSAGLIRALLFCKRIQRILHRRAVHHSRAHFGKAVGHNILRFFLFDKKAGRSQRGQRGAFIQPVVPVQQILPHIHIPPKSGNLRAGQAPIILQRGQMLVEIGVPRQLVPGIAIKFGDFFLLCDRFDRVFGGGAEILHQIFLIHKSGGVVAAGISVQPKAVVDYTEQRGGQRDHLNGSVG